MTIYVFKARHSGHPVMGEWVAATDTPEASQYEAPTDDLIDEVTSSRLTWAEKASEELSRRCHLAGGNTPQEAVERLLADKQAVNALCYDTYVSYWFRSKGNVAD